MVDVKKFSELDLYKLVGVEQTATESEVSKNKWINFTKILFIYNIFVDKEIIP